MPREMVTIQVGQCGNQIGCRFWELALGEHLSSPNQSKMTSTSSTLAYDDAMSSFFANDPPDEDHLYEGWKKSVVGQLRARAILVDMEESVVDRLQRLPAVGGLFNNQMRLTDVSGSGNNWAHGFHEYGTQYKDQFLDRVRLSVEECSSIQSFFMLHSLGGGTGSGFGSKILESLEDTFPKITRFACSVFPNDDDDVITSPYNALLSASKLIEHADCVFPVDNQALIDICNHIDANKKKTASRGGFRSSRVRRQDQQSVTGPDQGDTYHKMNGIAANMLLDLTASVRFEGTLNMDLSELPMNVVPYQRMHFLSCGMAPLFPPQQTLDISRNPGSQRALADMDKSFGSAHSSPINQLMRSPVPAKSSTYLASAILTRGQGIRVSDLERNVKKLQSQVNMVYWNTEGFKVSMCSKPPKNMPYSVLSVSNNCCFRHTLSAMHAKFSKLYKAKAYVQHYEDYGMSRTDFDEACDRLLGVVDEYTTLEGKTCPPANPKRRLKPVGLNFVPEY
ncbi:epsilon chain of tubulin [Chloropicon roscoffensis]|uniref:Epsilon chain of tubulin n=1 Tax=Chloropicon roscoffensis TaxID=1461544 RepID=A0AAX4P793_9CHLO